MKRRMAYYFLYSLRQQLRRIFVNIQCNVEQIKDILWKLQVGKLGRRIQWGLIQKDEVNKLRSSLESNKTALGIALSLGTISVHTRQIMNVKKIPEIAVALTVVDGKVDALINMHRDDSRYERIRNEIVTLRQLLLHSSVSNSGKSIILSPFMNQAKSFAKATLNPIRATDEHMYSLVQDLDDAWGHDSKVELDSRSSPGVPDENIIVFDPNDRSLATSQDCPNPTPRNSETVFELNLPSLPRSDQPPAVVDTSDIRQIENSPNTAAHGFHVYGQCIRRSSAPAKVLRPTVQVYNLKPSQTNSDLASSVSCIEYRCKIAYRRPIPVIEFRVIFRPDRIGFLLKSFALDALSYQHAPKKARNMSEDKVKSLMTDMLRLEKFIGSSASFCTGDGPSTILARYDRVIGEVLRVLDWKKAKKAVPSYRLLLQIRDEPLFDGVASVAHWSSMTYEDSVWLMIWDSGNFHAGNFDGAILTRHDSFSEDSPFPDPGKQNPKLISFKDDVVLKGLARTPGFMT